MRSSVAVDHSLTFEDVSPVIGVAPDAALLGSV